MSSLLKCQTLAPASIVAPGASDEVTHGLRIEVRQMFGRDFYRFLQFCHYRQISFTVSLCILSLTWSHVKPNISDGLKAVQTVRPMYERGFGVAFLWGTWGQAKTLVGKILTATAFRDGKTAAYANLISVLDDIRLAFDSDEHKTTELIRRMDWWVGRDVLFLDELDKANDTSWARERLFELIDRRYQRAVREEALTVIASNKSDDALDGYLKSRLADNRVGTVVELRGADARKVMPLEWKF